MDKLDEEPAAGNECSQDFDDLLLPQIAEEDTKGGL
jgi:hypothetical protein